MPIALVGQNGVPGGNHATPDIIAYTSTASNWLIIAGHFYNNGNSVSPAPISISDSAGNTWHYSATGAASPPTNSVTNSGNSTQIQTNFIAWTTQDVGPVTSVTLNRSDGTNVWYRYTLAEYSGIAQFDNSNAGSFTSTASVNMPTVTINTTGELVIVSDDNIAAAPSLPAGWTAFGASAGGDLVYQIGPATGAFSPNFTAASAGDWATAVAVFSPVSLGNVNGPAAGVSVSAPMGTVSTSVAGPAPANVAVAAPTGIASGGGTVNVNGAVAAVSVAAAVGTLSVATTGPGPATVLLAAPAGSTSVSLPGVAAQVTVVAPHGVAHGSGQSNVSLFLVHFP